MVEQFHGELKDIPSGLSDAVAAIKVLLELIKNSEGMSCIRLINTHTHVSTHTPTHHFTAGTIAGLQAEIKKATKALIEAKTSTVSVSSGCELFVRFITLTSKLGEVKVWQLKSMPFSSIHIE